MTRQDDLAITRTCGGMRREARRVALTVFALCAAACARSPSPPPAVPATPPASAATAATPALAAAMPDMAHMHHHDASDAASASTAASLPRGDAIEGERVARRVGCTGCHGRNGSGGELWSKPGDYTVRSANITEHRHHYDDAGLVALVREGRTHAGQPPFGMPIFMLQRMSDRELADVIAWVRALPDVPNPKLKRTWMSKAIAKQVHDGTFPEDDYLPDKDVHPPAAPPAEPLALGKHLALTSCTECHGRDLNGWGPDDDAPSLIVAKAYSAADFTRLMRTGITADGKPSRTGLMSTSARERFAPMTDAEISALKAYLDAR